MGSMEHTGTILVGKCEGMRALGIPVQNWEDNNVKMEEIQGENVV
jgi:hypothetical protein